MLQYTFFKITVTTSENIQQKNRFAKYEFEQLIFDFLLLFIVRRDIVF